MLRRMFQRGSWPLLALAATTAAAAVSPKSVSKMLDTDGASFIAVTDTNAVPLNSGGVLDRAACLSINLGRGLAYQCGDLIATHALPAVTVLGKNTGADPVLQQPSRLSAPAGDCRRGVAGWPHRAEQHSLYRDRQWRAQGQHGRASRKHVRHKSQYAQTHSSRLGCLL